MSPTGRGGSPGARLGADRLRSIVSQARSSGATKERRIAGPEISNQPKNAKTSQTSQRSRSVEPSLERSDLGGSLRGAGAPLERAQLNARKNREPRADSSRDTAIMRAVIVGEVSEANGGAEPRTAGEREENRTNVRRYDSRMGLRCYAIR